MKYRVCVLFAGLALAVPGLACADDGWSGNAAVTSSYISRGFDQSWHDPALQGGIDYNRNGWFDSKQLLHRGRHRGMGHLRRLRG